MRLEIVIPDSTRPEIVDKLTDLARDLSERPELVEEISYDDSGVEAAFTPERLALIDKALAEAEHSQWLTSDQAKARISQKSEAWKASQA